MEGHHHVFCEVRNLTAYMMRNLMRSSVTLVLMYIKPRHVICNGNVEDKVVGCDSMRFGR